MQGFQWQSRRVRLAMGVLFSAVLCFAGEVEVHYRLVRTRPLSRFNSQQIALLEKINHVDRAHLGRLPRLIVPDRWDLAELNYSPMPQFDPNLQSDPKALVVNVPGQVFGAYEYGTLVRWGPVSSGGRSTQTPPGDYRLHWNARVRISSVDPTWIMPWYFNFDDIIGLGFHEYTLPGKPASHGCVRMLEADAQWLFYWGRRGTPVKVKGKYDFAASRPWLQPDWWAQAVAQSLPPSAEPGVNAGAAQGAALPASAARTTGTSSVQ